MSTQIVLPGDLVSLDPSDKRIVIFDFDALNLAVGVTLSSYIFTIAPIQQNGATLLTADNVGLIAANRKVQARLLATTATRGDRYTVAVKGVTNESPSQEKEYSVIVKIEDH